MLKLLKAAGLGLFLLACLALLGPELLEGELKESLAMDTGGLPFPGEYLWYSLLFISVPLLTVKRGLGQDRRPMLFSMSEKLDMEEFILLIRTATREQARRHEAPATQGARNGNGLDISRLPPSAPAPRKAPRKLIEARR